MKLSRSSARRTLAAALVLACMSAAVAFVLAYASPAYASLEDSPTATSETNPNLPPVAWREGWGNSLWPQLTITGVPADAASQTLGFSYTLARTPIAPSVGLGKAGLTWDPTGSMSSHVFDLDGLYDSLNNSERAWVPVPYKMAPERRAMLERDWL